VVIGKLGYSTLAEVCNAGLPFGYIARKNFPESKHLASYAEQNINCMEIRAENFLNGDWISGLPDLFSMGKIKRPQSNGADLAARFIIDRA